MTPRNARVDGLDATIFLPEGEPVGGVVILHGAGSRGASHVDFARRCTAGDLAAVVFDQRGHGASDGPLDGRMAADVATIAGLLPDGPVALRGSSMGGYLALAAAAELDPPAGAVVAICPAVASDLAGGLASGRLGVDVDVPAVTGFLAAHPAEALAARLTCPLLLLHAEDDEVVPVAHSRALHAAAPGSELVVVPGGDHRSIQHDPALQERSVRFLRAALTDPSSV